MSAGEQIDPLRSAQIDHLVVVAASLEQGAAWCEATLGVTPGPGGEHAFMGTHNRLLRIATVDHPRYYLEVIAINPVADSRLFMPGKRWFDMDDAVLQAHVAAHGPTLAHVVASVPAVQPALDALARLGIDRGVATPASRMTPRGLLSWRITLRADGQRLFNGCLPTLIEWGAVHPAAAMPESGIALQALAVTHPEHQRLAAAFEAVGLQGMRVAAGAPELAATLRTPRGLVRLSSHGA